MNDALLSSSNSTFCLLTVQGISSNILVWIAIAYCYIEYWSLRLTGLAT